MKIFFAARCRLCDASSSLSSLDRGVSCASRMHGAQPTSRRRAFKLVTNVVHRFEQSIAGRPYLIEVANVSPGSLARLHRAHPRRADRAHAVLRPDAGRGGRTADRVAESRLSMRRGALDGVGLGACQPHVASGPSPRADPVIAVALSPVFVAPRPHAVRPLRPAPAAPDFDRMARQQAETDKAWRAASDGHMRLEKITYRSRAGDLDDPGVRLSTAEIARRQKPSGARLGPRGHPRPPVRALHSRTSAKRRRRATSSSRRNTAAESDTGRRSTTRSTTAAPRSTTW